MLWNYLRPVDGYSRPRTLMLWEAEAKPFGRLDRGKKVIDLNITCERRNLYLCCLRLPDNVFRRDYQVVNCARITDSFSELIEVDIKLLSQSHSKRKQGEGIYRKIILQ
jgi:hypothetical protein